MNSLLSPAVRAFSFLEGYRRVTGTVYSIELLHAPAVRRFSFDILDPDAAGPPAGCCAPGRCGTEGADHFRADNQTSLSRIRSR